MKLAQFVEKYQLALETALVENPQSGLCGFELEWNLLDERVLFQATFVEHAGADSSLCSDSVQGQNLEDASHCILRDSDALLSSPGTHVHDHPLAT